MLDEKELLDEKEFLQQMRAGPTRSPIFPLCGTPLYAFPHVLLGIVSEPGTLLMDDVPWRKSSEVFLLSKPWREAFRNGRDASEALLANTHLAHRLQSNPFHFRRHSVKDKVEP